MRWSYSDGFLRIGGMNSHVPIQVSWLREPQQTQFALIRFFPRVDPKVFGQCAGVRECLLAKPAAVRSLPGMGSHVRRHWRTLGEASVTNRTPERLLTGMRPDMSGQVCCLTKRLVAFQTTVRFLPAVGPQVCLESWGTSISLPTNSTQVWLGIVAGGAQSWTSGLRRGSW